MFKCKNFGSVTFGIQFISVENMNFEVPLVTNMHPEPPPAGSSAAARFNGITQGWSTTNDGEESMEVGT